MEEDNVILDLHPARRERYVMVKPAKLEELKKKAAAWDELVAKAKAMADCDDIYSEFLNFYENP